MSRAMSRPLLHPNVVTTLRLPLAPLAVVALLSDTLAGAIVAMVLGLLLEATDVADGWLARRHGLTSDFGKLYDPFSDAFTRFTLFLGFYAIDAMDLWMILLLFWRDSSVSFFRQVAAVRGVVVAARVSGKLKAIVQGVGMQVALLLLVLERSWPDAGLGQATWWVMATVAVTTAVSGVDYFIGNLPTLRAAWRDVSGD